MPYCRGKKWNGQCCVLKNLNTEMHIQLCLRVAPDETLSRHEKRVHSFLLKVCCVQRLPGTGTDGGKRLRSWIPGRDRMDRGHGRKTAKSLHQHPALRHNISLGVNIPSTCACLTVDESLCGGNATTPANGPFPSGQVPVDSGVRRPEGIALLGVLLLCADSQGIWHLRDLL